MAEYGEDPDLRDQASRAALRLGEIHTSLGDYPNAERAFEQGLRLVRQLEISQPDNKQWSRRLAQTLHSEGVMFSKSHQLDRAEDRFRQALKIRTALAKENRSLLGEQAASLYFLGVVVAKLTGRTQEALDDYREALAIQDGLCRDHPDNLDYERDLARTLNNLSILLRAHGKLDEAETNLDRAIGIQQQLLQADPQSASNKQAQGRSYANLAIVRLTRRQGEVREPFDRAIALFRELTHDYPSAPDYRRELADVYQMRGWYEEVASTPNNRVRARREAEKWYRESIAMLSKLVEDFPSTPEYRHKLSLVLNNLAMLLAETSYFEESKALLQRALTLQEELTRGSTKILDLQNDLGNTCYHFARYYLLLATDTHRRNQELALRGLLADTLFTWVVGLERVSSFVLARDYARRALVYHDKAQAGDTDNKDYATSISNDYLLIARVALFEGTSNWLPTPRRKCSNRTPVEVKGPSQPRTFLLSAPLPPMQRRSLRSTINEPSPL